LVLILSVLVIVSIWTFWIHVIVLEVRKAYRVRDLAKTDGNNPTKSEKPHLLINLLTNPSGVFAIAIGIYVIASPT